MSLYDPIVIDPPNLDTAAIWAECKEAGDNLTNADGSTNWKAAFAADPGVCSCPACHRMHWHLGRVQRCTGCSFEYPTDWWSMYSWGAQAARRREVKPYKHDARMGHPYYRYGFEHPVDDPCEERDRIDWRAVIEAKP